MAVSDGHGGRRHGRSDVGSRLACEQAIAAVTRGLEQRSLDTAFFPEGLNLWRQWLSMELPLDIHRAWLAAVRHHWQAGGGATGTLERAPGNFSSVAYGCTLGLVLLTPDWWGHTGLGDWDLVAVDRHGTARLVSEECFHGGCGGEATSSLCLDGAATMFQERSGLHRLPNSQAGDRLSLVLSTDGIRKGCATDDDFLTLIAWLAEASLPREELEQTLDHISREGSGDDVSVALAQLRVRSERSAGSAMPT